LILILIAVAAEISSNYLKKSLKETYINPYKHVSKFETHADFYLIYYQKLQYINIFRVVVLVLLLTAYFSSKDISILNILGIAVWAIILTFQPYIIGFANYLDMLTGYRVGQTIKVGGEYQWEIIYIKPQTLGISGINEWWEHNGKFYIVPMSEVKKLIITKLDLTHQAVEKAVLNILYQREIYILSFTEFVLEFEGFLNTLLKRNTLMSAGHFESYIGYKYKMNFEYTKDGHVMIYLGFLAKGDELNTKTRVVIEWVEEKKK
jgi:hypothetical protein